MNRGPQPGAPGRGGDARSFVEKATAAWGDELPDWVRELADHCDQTPGGLGVVGKKLSYSAPVISTVISRKYPGDIGRIEEKVRGLLMGLTVLCPVLDEISRNTCLDWQKKPRAQTSSLRARMWRACAGCEHFRAHAQRAQMEAPNGDE